MKRILSLFAAMLFAVTAVQAQQGDTVLKPTEVQKYIPASVFFRGQQATTQLRNSGGVKFADGFFVLATAVDTSGYSTDVQAKYQDYFITEVTITLGGHTLAPGAYGVGFIADNKFVVLDLGNHELFTVDSGTDGDLKRPTPLAVSADPAGGFRLYSGRRFVNFKR